MLWGIDTPYLKNYNFLPRWLFFRTENISSEAFCRIQLLCNFSVSLKEEKDFSLRAMKVDNPKVLKLGKNQHISTLIREFTPNTPLSVFSFFGNTVFHCCSLGRLRFFWVLLHLVCAQNDTGPRPQLVKNRVVPLSATVVSDYKEY